MCCDFLKVDLINNIMSYTNLLANVVCFKYDFK